MIFLTPRQVEEIAALSMKGVDYITVQSVGGNVQLTVWMLNGPWWDIILTPEGERVYA